MSFARVGKKNAFWAVGKFGKNVLFFYYGCGIIEI